MASRRRNMQLICHQWRITRQLLDDVILTVRTRTVWTTRHFKQCWGRCQLGQNHVQLVRMTFRLVLSQCNSVPICGSFLEPAAPAWRCGDTSPGALWRGGVHKRRSEHGSSAGIADGRLQSAIIPPQTFRLCPGLHTRFIILHDVGRGQSQIMNLAAVGALDTAGHAGRSGQNWVLVSGGTWCYAVSRQHQPNYLHYNSVSQKRLLADSFRLRKQSSRILTSLLMYTYSGRIFVHSLNRASWYSFVRITKKTHIFLNNLFHLLYPRHVSNK